MFSELTIELQYHTTIQALITRQTVHLYQSLKLAKLTIKQSAVSAHKV